MATKNGIPENVSVTDLLAAVEKLTKTVLVLQEENAALKAAKTVKREKHETVYALRVADRNSFCGVCSKAIYTGDNVLAAFGFKPTCETCWNAGKSPVASKPSAYTLEKHDRACLACRRSLVPGETVWYVKSQHGNVCSDCVKTYATPSIPNPNKTAQTANSPAKKARNHQAPKPEKQESGAIDI
jgi:hypothetical protein